MRNVEQEIETSSYQQLDARAAPRRTPIIWSAPGTPSPDTAIIFRASFAAQLEITARVCRIDHADDGVVVVRIPGTTGRNAAFTALCDIPRIILNAALDFDPVPVNRVKRAGEPLGAANTIRVFRARPQPGCCDRVKVTVTNETAKRQIDDMIACVPCSLAPMAMVFAVDAVRDRMNMDYWTARSRLISERKRSRT